MISQYYKNGGGNELMLRICQYYSVQEHYETQRRGAITYMELCWKMD